MQEAAELDQLCAELCGPVGILATEGFRTLMAFQSFKGFGESGNFYLVVLHNPSTSDPVPPKSCNMK